MNYAKPEIRIFKREGNAYIDTAERQLLCRERLYTLGDDAAMPQRVATGTAPRVSRYLAGPAAHGSLLRIHNAPGQNAPFDKRTDVFGKESE